MVQRGSGFFEVTNNKILLCSGILQANDIPDKEFSQTPITADKEIHDLSEHDIYTELQMRGLLYSGPWRIINKLSAKGSSGILVWRDDWTTFLEGMIQMQILENDTRKLQIPIKIRKIVINLKLQEETKSNEFLATVHRGTKTVNAGGIQMEGIVLESFVPESWKNVIAEKIQIVPSTDKTLSYKQFPITSNIRHVSTWTVKQLQESDLVSFSWVEDSSEKVANTIKVEYSAVNDADILLATTKAALEDTEKSNRLGIKSFGQEYSGIDTNGTRIMGLVPSGSLSSYTSADIDYTWKVPDNWSLEDAATVPLAYAVAYLALVIKGEVQSNKSIFVYDGVSSIGQAVINLVMNIKSEVFAGHVSDEDKRNLKHIFPNIPDNHFTSLTGTFADRIVAQTEGKGADLVIYNADDLDKLDSCLMAVKNKGKVIIIDNLQKTISKSVGMQIFFKEIALISIAPSQMTNRDSAMKKELAQMISNGIATQIVKPLPRRIYTREMLKDAFIDGATKMHSEKIIVKVQPKDESRTALAVPRFLCKTEGVYLIIEGLSDFGLELVDFLVLRGVKNIVIASESKNTRAYGHQRINLWKECGVSVTVREEQKFSHQQNGIALLDEVSVVGRLDAIFDLQRIDNSSKRSSISKYMFTKQLFEESNQRCPGLRKFVVFSTCKDNQETVDDILLREIDVEKICEEKSNSTFRGLLVLLGQFDRMSESKTEKERNAPLLSISSIMEQMEYLIGAEASVVSISRKLQDICSEKVEKEFTAVEEADKTQFEKDVNQGDSMASPVGFRCHERIIDVIDYFKN